MRPSTRTQTPFRIYLPCFIDDDFDVTRATNGIKPMVCGGLIAVGDGDDGDVGVRVGCLTEVEERLFCKGAAAVAEESYDCCFVGWRREGEFAGDGRS